MKQITCIFFGKSGAGKGTQADLLLKYLAEKDPKNKAVYMETGDRFRAFVKSDNYTAKLTKEIMSAGGLMPPFLPIYTWTSLLVENVSGPEHLIFDGVARQPEEAPVLDSAMQFYKRDKVVVILLEVNPAEAKKRLLLRGRNDDESEKIDRRLHWFETNVMPSVNYFEKSPNCEFMRINGDQSIEAVNRDVMKALGL